MLAPISMMGGCQPDPVCMRLERLKARSALMDAPWCAHDRNIRLLAKWFPRMKRIAGSLGMPSR